MSNRKYRNIWESVNGPIPVDSEGRSFEIHHVDGDHYNNDINNLVCVSIQEHYDIHYKQGDYAACHLIAQRMHQNPKELSKVISKLNSMRTGDKNPFYGKKHTEETKAIIRKKVSGENHPFYGKKRPEEFAAKVSAALKGRSKTEEHKKAISASRVGKASKKYVWEVQHHDDIILVTNLKEWCRERGFSYGSFYGRKEIDGYQLLGRSKETTCSSSR